MKLWQQLSAWTEARIGLGQAGSALPTQAHLATAEAQALARDALWRKWNPETLRESLTASGWPSLTLQTEVNDRQTFLARPDLGRRLRADATAALASLSASLDCIHPRLVICISDGLSAAAIEHHAESFLKVFLPRLQAEPFYRGLAYPIVLLPFARVAAADAIGAAAGADISVIIIGERPGLSAHDSLGIYVTYQPRIGRDDSERNCISNVRPPGGLAYDLASEQLCYLLRESLHLKLSGVNLKMQDMSIKDPLPEASFEIETSAHFNEKPARETRSERPL